jgi:hypothetical protein
MQKVESEACPNKPFGRTGGGAYFDLINNFNRHFFSKFFIDARNRSG